MSGILVVEAGAKANLVKEVIGSSIESVLYIDIAKVVQLYRNTLIDGRTDGDPIMTIKYKCIDYT